jgi:DHA2 family multidrug resistance protein
VGGSIGLAIGATLLTRYGGDARSALVAHVVPSNPAAISRIQGMTQSGLARGMDWQRAHDIALRSLDGLIDRQATLLAFERVFLLAGIAFLAVLPLLYFLKVPDADPDAPKKEKVDVHIE